MIPRFRLSLLVALAAAATASAVETDTLLKRSPFAPPASANPTTTQPEVAQLEFRGITHDSGGQMFSVFDLSANRGYWLKEGEASGPLAVKTYDRDGQMLEITRNGEVTKLKLARAQIQAGAAIPLPPPPVAGVPPPNGAAPNNNAAATAANDAKRLEAVAAEVRRRRALRNAAAAQAGRPAAQPATAQPASAAPAAPPPAP